MFTGFATAPEIDVAPETDVAPEEESDLPVEDRAQGSDSGSNADALTSPRAAARALVARVERPICRVPRPERTDTPGR